MPVRPQLSNNPLARPETLVQELAVEVQNYLHFPDPQPLYVTLGALVANMIRGKPCWLMLVGSSGSGKTELLLGITDIPGVYMAEDLTGPGAFLSGTSAKEKAKGATGGLLRKIGSRGAILMEDFTSSVMGLPRDTRQQILTAFRLMYKGRWARDLGTDGGLSLVWEGKLAALAGGTLAIDRLTAEQADLGERWIYYRLPKKSGFGETRKSLQNVNPEESAAKFRTAIKEFFEALELRWPCHLTGLMQCRAGHEHTPELPRREFTLAEQAQLIGLATLTAKMRSAVYRHPYTREIEDIPAPETPTRLANTLGQLYLGLEVIGLREYERWPIVSKVAMDSVSEQRARVVNLCWQKMKANSNGHHPVVSVEEAQVVMRCSDASVRRTVEDLIAHEIVVKNSSGVYLSDEIYEELERYFR